MRALLYLLSLALIACVTDTQSKEFSSQASAGLAASPAPDASAIEQAHKNDDLEWIATRFAGSEGTLNFHDAYDDFWIWQYVGYAFLRTGDYPRAAMALRKVLGLKPNFSPAIYNLACVAALSQQSEKALELLQLLASRVRAYESLADKYHKLVSTDPDLVSLKQHADYPRTLALFE